MLVLTRKKNQAVMIGDQISVTILEIKGDAVRIGISAPGDTVILRGELYKKVREENLTAAGSDSSSAELLKKIMRKR
ncbi:MAG: carbon storage regulator CsrA [Firmicutes bacterium]|nr:carbon storage regulator CsrA [Bacillota bacterium]